jgi:hypothetical protein
MQSIGGRCGVDDCRPHRLRDTFAVRALFAGHPDWRCIETTCSFERQDHGDVLREVDSGAREPP